MEKKIPRPKRHISLYANTDDHETLGYLKCRLGLDTSNAVRKAMMFYAAFLKYEDNKGQHPPLI